MKQLSFFLPIAIGILLLPFSLLAQENIVPGIIILKVKQANADAWQAQMSEDQWLAENAIASVERKYPHAERPEPRQTDKHGNPFVDLTRTYKLTLVEGADVLENIKKLEESGQFEWVEPTTYSQSFTIPNDPQVGTLDHLLHANLYASWDTTQGDTNVIMGITDTSFDLLHEDLQGNLKYNYADPIDGTDNDNDGYTDNYRGWDIWGDDNGVFFTNDWHGTGVLAVAAATTNNGVGMAGAGFKCKYLPVKIANDATNGNTTIVTADGHDAITYCADRDCKVINCSWGTLTYSNDGQDVVNYATINKDAVVVAASGNTNAEEFRYPASFYRAVSVTGVHNTDEFNNGVNAPFTRSDSVDVCAQGYNVMATATVGASGSTEVYQTTGGTSIASPIVCGAVAIIRSAYPCLTAIEAADLLIASAVDIENVGTNSSYAGKIGKRIDTYAALQNNPCLTVGVNDVSREEVSVSVYPNPSSDQVNITMSQADNWHVQVLDTKGRIIINQQFKGTNMVLSGLAAGFYVARISNDEQDFSARFSVITP
ncbi:MAG: S8 family peptidase [Flavobacteriales bacterium]|nr:S8 family peptidase [Flavobacteriales bacterium]MCB9204737.1 S8 family peptidase [Flavobacteriales bacterium]